MFLTDDVPERRVCSDIKSVVPWEVYMIRLTQLVIVASLLVLSACAESRIFDTNCSGNGMITNAGYCTGTLHPYAGPWSTR